MLDSAINLPYSSRQSSLDVALEILKSHLQSDGTQSDKNKSSEAATMVDATGKSVNEAVAKINQILIDSEGHVENIQGGLGEDVISVRASSADTIHGNDGDDVIYIEAYSGRGLSDVNAIGEIGYGIKRVDGGSGDDIINLKSELVAIINGGSGNDTIIVGSYSADSINGDDGDDIIDLNTKRVDAVYGGDGDDVIHINSDDLGIFSGGAGDDQMFISANGGSRTLVLTQGDGQDYIEIDSSFQIMFKHQNDVLTDSGEDALSMVKNEDGTYTLNYGSKGDSLTIKFTGEMSDIDLDYSPSNTGVSVLHFKKNDEVGADSRYTLGKIEPEWTYNI